MKTTIKMLTLTLITLLLNILNTQTSKAQCHIDDWTALKALYESTNGDLWINRTGWGTVLGENPPANCNLENLFGISLNAIGRVSCIDLDGDDNCGFSDTVGNNLTGNIPKEIGSLSYLTYLSFSNNYIHESNNKLTGSIPPEIGNLENLTNLSMVRNLLSGNIPPQIGNLSNLSYLNLGANSFTGSIPTEIGNLSNLSFLNLGLNLLTESIPPELGNLSKLQNLYLNNNWLNGNIPAELGNLENLKNLYLYSNYLSGSIPPEFGNLSSLTWVKLYNNNLDGCFSSNLLTLCTQFTSPFFDGNVEINGDNNFDAFWEIFCATEAGICIDEPFCGCTNPAACNYNPVATCDDGSCDNSCCGCTDPTACNYNPNVTCDDGNCQQDCEIFVYPGDLNHDGIVNNQDVSLSGLFMYQSGIARASEHQTTEWDLYPSQDWGILNNQNKDIKHHDCDGNGIIDESDTLALVNNMGLTWKTPDPPPQPPSESDYQVILQPTDQVYDGYLVFNVALEKRTGGDLMVQGGHFTVDYSDVEGTFSYAGLDFELISWLGVPGNDLWYESTSFSNEKKIEVGFTKTDNIDSEGSGVIGKLILQYNTGTAKRANTSYNFEVNTIGVHQKNGDFIPIEDQQLEVIINPNNCEPNWNINEDSPFQNLYQSSNNLTTNGFVIIGEDQEVEYKADRVRINSGFSAKAGAKFKVRTGACN